MIRWRSILAGLAILVVALGLRLSTRPEVPIPRGDETYYVEVATTIAAGQGHRYNWVRCWRPPLHAWMLSHHVDLDAVASKQRMLDQQLLWSLLLVLISGVGARQLFGTTAGWVAAGLAAVHPELIGFSHTLWSENLFGLLITAAVLGVVRMQGGAWWVAGLTGAMLGLAALTRDMALGLGVVMLGWFVLAGEPAQRLPRLRRAVLCGLVMLAVVYPWTSRNQEALGRWAGISTIGWFALAEGNSLETHWRAYPGPEQHNFRSQYYAVKSESARIDLAQEWAWQKIRDHQPWWLPKKLARAISVLAGPDSYVNLKLARHSYGDLGRATVRTAVVAVGLGTLLTLAAALLGVVTAPRRVQWLVGSLFAAILAVHVLANAATRFRVPWIPLLIILAASWMADPARLRRISIRTWILLATVTAIVLALALPGAAPNLKVMWEMGAAAGDDYRPW